jgi:hypothetical protein
VGSGASAHEGGGGAHTKQPTHIQLVCPRDCKVAPGDEVTINYGDKGNEELLLTHGFAVRDNPHEVSRSSPHPTPSIHPHTSIPPYHHTTIPPYHNDTTHSHIHVGGGGALHGHTLTTCLYFSAISCPHEIDCTPPTHTHT